MVCKRGTELPELDGAERWDEPDEPRHPLTGIVHALERADGPVLVCAADMPFVTADACRTLLEGAGGASPAVVAVAKGVLQPVLGLYAPGGPRGPARRRAGRAAHRARSRRSTRFGWRCRPRSSAA